jgi:molybdopterin-guanine dinucleotide biosynthesis protein A
VADRDLTGILLVGGSSTRFGAPKALARLGGETLAERAWRLLNATCAETIAVGKRADALPLPFPIVDDASPVRAPIAGVVAGLRAARHGVSVVVPVDVPLLSAASIQTLADACADVAVSDTGPLPGAYRKSALPQLEDRLRRGKLALRGAVAELDARVVALDPWELANVNEPADLVAVERRARALDAAAALAARLGLGTIRPRILQDWNDTIVHLAPQRLVARVATSGVRSDDRETQTREVAVARHVSARGGPVVAPATRPRPGPHEHDALSLTLWEYVEVAPREVPPMEAAAALRALHRALADYAGPLPTLEERHARAHAAVSGDLPALEPDRRRFLRHAFERLRQRAHGASAHVLHGGPHSGNLLPTRDGLLWIDLDTVCRGPLEWDVAHLHEEAAALFPEVDSELLATMKLLVSAEVAIWCFSQYGRAPEVDEAAHFHLAHLEEARI